MITSNDDTIHASPHPLLSLPRICRRAFIAEGGAAFPLRGDRRKMTSAAAAPDGSPNWSFPPSPHRHRPLLPCRRLKTSYANCLHDLRASTCHHPQDLHPPQRGSSMTLKGHWLMTMEHRMAENNADNNDCVLLLPLPSPSSAHLVAAVLSVQTLPDTPLPSPPLSSSHCLIPDFFIVECPHHRSITSSPCQLLLAFTSLPSMVGCYVHVRFVVRHPLSSLQVSMLLSTADALFCPSPYTALLLSSPAAACLCCSSVNGLLFRLCPLRRPPSVLLSAARFHHLTPSCKHRRFRCWPPPPFAAHHQPPATDACLCRSPINGWLLRPPPSIILHPLLSLSACAIIDDLVANTE